MKSISLNGTWNLYYYNQKEYNIKSPEQLENIPKINAEVPGNIELDLSEAGLLPEDLFMGENIRKTKDFEEYDWWYETDFETPELIENQRCSLKFGGVDCYADYWLNGEKVASSENMLIPTEFDVTGKLLANGKNHLLVHIRSVVLESKKIFESSEKTLFTSAYCLPRASLI